MRSTAIRIAIALGLIVVGWAAGRAQTSAPDFELVVNSPKGEVTVQCVQRVRARVDRTRRERQGDADVDVHLRMRGAGRDALPVGAHRRVAEAVTKLRNV